MITVASLLPAGFASAPVHAAALVRTNVPRMSEAESEVTTRSDALAGDVDGVVVPTGASPKVTGGLKWSDNLSLIHI